MNRIKSLLLKSYFNVIKLQNVHGTVSVMIVAISL